jgi:pimeloyl-ACP methyl ester carboxylesterase
MATVDVSGVKIHYEIAGNGPPIVLVHGLASRLQGNWGQFGWIDFLTAAGRQVIGLDLRGHGSSDKPHDPALYTGTLMADDVIAVMNAVGLDRADVMGYSLGGWLTASLLSRHSGRFNSAVVGGSGAAPSRDPSRRAEAVAAFEADDPSTIRSAIARGMRQFAEDRGNDLDALAALMRATWTPASEAALRQLALPVLVVVGDQDPALEAARELADIVPGARLEILPGTDHGGASGHPGYKRAVGEFLAEVSPVSTRAVVQP